MNCIAIAFFALFLISVCGCDSKDYAVAPVSGTVTFEGKPVDKLRVSFNPSPVGENYAVGPFSQGKTDANGKFTLVTRYKEEGAVVGKHKLAFEYTDIDEEAMANLREKMAEAQEEGNQARFAEAKKEVVELKKKLKGRPVLEKRYTKSVDVPADGYTDLQVELTDIQ